MSPVRSSSLNPAFSEPLSSVRVCRSSGGSSHKRGTSASPEAAAVLFSSLVSTKTDLCAPCNWAALPGLLQHRPNPPPLPKAGFAGTGCGRRAISIRPGNRPLPGRTCFAACGGGRRGANGDGLYLQAVQQRRSSGRYSPFDAHGLIPLDSPGEYALQFAQETSRYGASRRPR